MSPDAAAKPSILLVLVAGLVCPGAGLVAAGRLRTGLAFSLLFVALALLVPLAVLAGELDLQKLPGLVRAASLALWAPAAVFGVVAAASAPPAPRRPWQHPWWLLGVVIVTWTARLGVSERVIGKHVVAFVTPSEAQLRAVAPPDAEVRGVFVVAKRRFAPADVTAGAWVLVQDAAGQEVATRVVSTASGILLDDGRTVSHADLRGAGALAR